MRARSLIFHAAELPTPPSINPVDSGHQMVMRALDISVLVGFAHSDQPGPHPSKPAARDLRSPGPAGAPKPCVVVELLSL